jgi:LacI family transcriptional regulator
MDKKITIKDIAKKADVSASTVSRVLNETLPVKKETKEKIMKIINELNYYPDSLARSLRVGSTKTIGIIIPDISNPFFSMLVKGAEDYLRKQNYSTIICNSNNKKEDEKIVKLLLEKKVDAILYAGIGNLKNLEKIQTPIIYIDRIEKNSNSSFIVSNNYQGMTTLLEYLLKNKHKTYTFISGDETIFSASERLRAFTDFSKKHQIKSQIIKANYTFQSGLEIAEKIQQTPDVIVCSNDLIAYGIIQGLKNRKINVPKDVSVTGYDDILFSAMLNPSLTTVRQPIYQMGKTASEIVIKILQKKLKEPPIKMFKNELIIRNSVIKRK